MNWKRLISKFSGKMTKEKWLFLLLLGVFFMILAFPLQNGGTAEKETKSGSADSGTVQKAVPLWVGEEGKDTTMGEAEKDTGGFENGDGGIFSSFQDTEEDTGQFAAAASPANISYESRLEGRVREVLKSVDGVGKVEVMIVLKSSSEKVLRVDRSASLDTTNEKDSSGGERKVTGSQSGESTVLAGSGSQNTPIVEKELSPEISGIIISAQGGGSPVVKAEISEAMEALFGLPPHKIKVLKRVE